MPEGSIPESVVIWDPDGGHNHDGTVSRAITIAGDVTGLNTAVTVEKLRNVSLTAPTSGDDEKFLKYDHDTTAYVWGTPPGTSHNLLSSVHPDTTAASPTRGDIITAQGVSPTWSRLAIGLSGRYLRSDGTDAAWAQIPYGDLTFSGLTAGHVWKATGASAASFGALQHSQLDPASIGANDHHNQAHTFFGSDHSDVSGTPAAGDIIYRNGSSTWVRLAKGSDNQVLTLSSGLPAWISPASPGISGIAAQVGDSTVAAAATTLDFNGTDFEGTESPANEFNVNLKARALLSALFNDVTAGSPTRGDIITAQGASPTWTKLAKGVDGTVLKMGANEPAWGSVGIGQLSQGGTSADDDLKSPVYEHDNTAVILSWPGVELCGWRRDNVNNAATSFGECPMYDGVTTGRRMPAGGYIIGMGIALGSDVGGSGTNYEAIVYKAAGDSGAYSATAIAAVVTGDTGTQRGAHDRVTDASDAVAFDEGDFLTIYDKRTGTPNVGATLVIYVVFNWCPTPPP